MTLDSNFPETGSVRPLISTSGTTLDCGNVLKIKEAQSASSAPNSARPDKFETLEYIADLSGGLAEMAATINKPVLARLLAIAEEEARRSMPDL